MAGVEIEGLAELQAMLAAEAPALDRDLRAALGRGADLVTTRAGILAPVRSGLLQGSIRTFLEEAAAGTEVTARRRSARYPGGYPYPVRVERRRRFLARAIEMELQRVWEALEGVLDRLGARWRGA